MNREILSLNNVNRAFVTRKSLFGKTKLVINAVNQVDLIVNKGQTVGIVGESGCGKSTLARMIVLLDQPTEGSILFQGKELSSIEKKEMKQFRSKVQFVFQDPLSSLNPRKTIRQILETPLRHLTDMTKQERADRVDELMTLVNLRPEFLERYPHQFSGGQSQRIGIARSIAANPEMIVLDEPVSALDVSVQAQVLNLLRELKERLNLTYIFISHDLAVVENVCDVVAVMYLGRIVEYGPRKKLFANPRHPYTHILLSSVPVPGKQEEDRPGLKGEPPSPSAMPPGCPFEPRCPHGVDRCKKEKPILDNVDADPRAACFFPL